MRNLSELNYVELSQEVADEVQVMALRIATIARQVAAMHRNVEDITDANRFARINLEFSMTTMLEVMGNLLNGLDAVEESDAERSGAIFAELGRRFPEYRDCSLQGPAYAVRLISNLNADLDDARYREAVKEIIERTGFADPLVPQASP